MIRNKCEMEVQPRRKMKVLPKGYQSWPTHYGYREITSPEDWLTNGLLVMIGIVLSGQA